MSEPALASAGLAELAAGATLTLSVHPTDTPATIQAILDAGTAVIFQPGTYTGASSGFPWCIKVSGQKLYGYGATINTVGVGASAFSIGNNGSGGFVKTDNVTIEGFNFVGQADGSNASNTAYAIGVNGPPTVPYSEGIGCSHIKIINCTETGFCFGIVATGADDVLITDFRFGGNRYVTLLNAGGYGVLLQSCFRVTITRPHGTALANDRHAIYVSSASDRAFDNNNICKTVIITDCDINWSGVSGTTGFEAAIEVRSAENFQLLGGEIIGGYGGLEYDACNGNGKNVKVVGVSFRDQTAGASTRACCSIIRTSGAYTTDTVVVSGCTFLPAHANMFGLALSNINNLVVTGNNGTDTQSIALVQVAGNVTNAYFGNNTWRDDSQYVYQIVNTGNADIIWGQDGYKLTGPALLYQWLSYPARPRFGFARTVQVSATSSATPVIAFDEFAIVASVVNDANGLKVTFQNNVNLPSNQKVFCFSTGNGVAYCFMGSVVGQAAVFAVLNQAGAVLPGLTNTYSLTVLVTS